MSEPPLPPLPEPFGSMPHKIGNAVVMAVKGFTPDQMRTYAKAAVAAHKAEQALQTQAQGLREALEQAMEAIRCGDQYLISHALRAGRVALEGAEHD